jgi:hypothetical protein
MLLRRLLCDTLIPPSWKLPMEADEVDRFSFMFVRYGVELSGLKMPLYSGSPTWSWLVLMSDVLMCNFLYSV